MITKDDLRIGQAYTFSDGSKVVFQAFYKSSFQEDKAVAGVLYRHETNGRSSWSLKEFLEEINKGASTDEKYTVKAT